MERSTRVALGPVLAGLVGVLAIPFPASAWGPIAHQAVTVRALDTLPKGLESFYKRHRLEIPSLSPEATFQEEGPDRRFLVDRFLPFPFLELPRSETAWKARVGEAARDAGRLPWLIQESHARLVDAFKAGDKARILAESDVLAWLVTDLHNPLALTDNSDGQKSAQHGLWARIGTRYPEAIEHRLKLDPDAAVFLDDPREYVFSMVKGTYIWLDNLLYEEELARRGQSGYTETYYAALESRAGELIKRLLSRATTDVGSYWYSAWTAAGRPELK